ncbi:tRNA 2-selenouridine(34) synthase MnmH [Tepidibacillus sp. HK-1]|uniref:tRNA 2-selenouridine(34) synthase MnmH n=1 Tax=Tepidibacillus sp. HK-1 TaxID=1883407 RepID=UPI00085779A6|nr:tRNA 2-selenouridine(34) synthase MnmH [Tepidibacillus sp. HK-1]GBF10957.1 tRNA 2-selenouridine synthase [Tepidibacillus sp. HK-1]
MFKDIQYTEIEDKKHHLLIDVRSPNEYHEATIPGAINIPLFDNEERALVGTVYKEKGSDIARELGLEIVSPKIPQLVKQVRQALQPGQVPVFFCWRGGMRSKSMATFYSLIYPEPYRLEGGYRAYRQYIVEEIPKMDLNIPTFVLHGMTGVGKTTLLYKLKELGLSIIDLEGMAHHRGSAFGAIGLEPVNQKTFDSQVYEVLKEIRQARAVVIEAESKRIGKIIVPDNIMNAKEHGHHILITASQPIRIQRILEEYRLDQYKEPFIDGLKRIERKLPTEVRPLLFAAVEKNEFYQAIQLLLEYYYDPRYQFATDQYQGSFFEVNSDNLDHAAREIVQYIENKIAAFSLN